MRDTAHIGFLLLVSLAVHCFMAVGMGAKFWWDTITYFQLSDALRDLGSLHDLYSGPFGIIFQHLMPGLPVLILLFERLFGSALWLAFAVFQNGLDVLASVYLATAFSGTISRAGQLAIVILIALFPYFSAFHNALLTESITASIVMLMIGVTVRCLTRRIQLTWAIIALAVLAIIGGNFRSYVVLVGGGLIVLSIYSTAGFGRLRLYAIPIVTVLVGTSIFPVYRTLAGIELFYPSVDSLSLAYANYTNWQLDDRSRHAVESVVSDPAILHKLESENNGITPDDVVKMVYDLEANGFSRSEAIRKIKQASLLVRTQSWEVIRRQLQLSLSSLGFQRIATCCSGTFILQNGGYTGKKMLAHLQFYYRWNAGLSPSNYVSLFDEYTARYRAMPQYYSSTVIDWYVDRIRPHILEHPTPWRNALGLNSISPDALVILGVIGFAVLSLRDWRLGVIIWMLVTPVYLSALYATFVGDNRHAHLLWPFYILGIVALIDSAAPRLLPRTARHFPAEARK